jgi:hypothetical protein
LSRPISGSIAGERLRVEVLRVVVERAVGGVGLALLVGLLLRLPGVRLGRLRDAMRDVVDDVQPRDALLLQEVHGVRVLLAEDGDQHVGAGDFLLAGTLHVQDGALDHALEAERGLRVDLAVGRDARRLLGDVLGQALAQLVHVGAAGPQDLRRRGVVEQGQQQVLDRDEFVALLARLDERHVKADFELLGDHRCTFAFIPLPDLSTRIRTSIARQSSCGSITHCSGCWCFREYAATCCTLVFATSRGKTPQTPIPSLWTLSMTCVARSRLMPKNFCRTTTTNSMGV